MQREIKLDGGEITILKTIGFSGSPIPGRVLHERAGDMEVAEFLDTLQGLLALDYIRSNKVNVRTIEDVDSAFFRINATYARDLRDATVPGGRKREEERPRRRRRS